MGRNKVEEVSWDQEGLQAGPCEESGRTGISTKYMNVTNSKEQTKLLSSAVSAVKEARL